MLIAEAKVEVNQESHPTPTAATPAQPEANHDTITVPQDKTPRETQTNNINGVHSSSQNGDAQPSKPKKQKKPKAQKPPPAPTPPPVVFEISAPESVFDKKNIKKEKQSSQNTEKQSQPQEKVCIHIMLRRSLRHILVIWHHVITEPQHHSITHHTIIAPQHRHTITSQLHRGIVQHQPFLISVTTAYEKS